jgi:dihydrofolate reductase
MPRSVRKRKSIVYVAVSADGFIARPDGSVDWLDRPHPKGNYGMGAFYRSIDTCVLGRKTYDLAVSEDVPAFAERLRLEKGKDIWLVDGAELVAAFLDSEQVDEFIIHVIPKMIGEGIPLVAARHRDLGLKLLATKSFPDGVVKLHYAARVK